MNPQFIAIKLLRALVTLWLIVTFAFVILRMSGVNGGYINQRCSLKTPETPVKFLLTTFSKFDN